MLRNLLFVFCFFLAGCAAKKHTLTMMPAPEPGTREALLPQFAPSGSPCLDSIIVNYLYSGCQTVGSIPRDEYEGLLLGCLAPQPGAMDVFSTSTFLFSANPVLEDPLLGEGIPYCADVTGLYVVLSNGIRNFGADE